MIISRLSGIVMFVNTLLPALLVVGLISIGTTLSPPARELSYAVGQMAHEANLLRSPYNKAMKITKSKIKDSKTRIASAQKAHKKLVKIINKGFSALNIKVKFPRFPKIPGVKLPKLPDIDIKIGDILAKPFKNITNGLGYLFTIFSNISDIGEEWSEVFENQSLERLTEHAEDAKDATYTLLEKIQTIVTVVFWLLVVLIPWLLLSYSLWSYSRIKRALTLIRGEKKPPIVPKEMHNYPPMPQEKIAA